MGADRVEEWKRFSEHMEKYIREQTVLKYGMGNSAGGGTFDLMSITKPEVCVWNILRYSLRNWNGKGKEHDLEKIAHYAEMAWTMGSEKDSNGDSYMKGKRIGGSISLSKDGRGANPLSVK